MCDSLRISKCTGVNAADNFCSMASLTGPLATLLVMIVRNGNGLLRRMVFDSIDGVCLFNPGSSCTVATRNQRDANLGGDDAGRALYVPPMQSMKEIRQGDKDKDKDKR
mmetsp:Transcript_16356/g.35341  ORF Transcript_16356/g.35341 Transcript_16356/m.35341 type:complete len:109 (+) Transcript_16356:5991-6317(+)